MPKPSTEPPRRTATVRDALVAALRESPVTAYELSARVGIRERDVAEHLEHVRRTLEAHNEALHVAPATCLGCGYVFQKRERLTRPSACDLTSLFVKKGKSTLQFRVYGLHDTTKQEDIERSVAKDALARR